jgi:hypothetical protein
MNNTPNAKLHKIGDLVIHDADAKRNSTLMIVTGFTRDGQVKTVYLPGGINDRRRVWKNNPACLHDPRRPDIRARWRGPAFEDALPITKGDEK